MQSKFVVMGKVVAPGLGSEGIAGYSPPTAERSSRLGESVGFLGNPGAKIKLLQKNGERTRNVIEHQGSSQPDRKTEVQR